MTAVPGETPVTTPDEVMVAVPSRIHHDDTVVSATELPSE
jgi:hypothetical protein